MMRMKYLFMVLCGIMVLSAGCSEKSEKIHHNINQGALTGDPVSTESFEDFYARFCSDSVFQKERIAFPINQKVVAIDKTGTNNSGASGDQYNFKKIEKSDWTYVNYKSWEKDFLIEFHKGPGVYTVEFKNREVGMGYMLIFGLDAGKWNLVDMIDLST
jgi:hypothetical protein